MSDDTVRNWIDVSNFRVFVCTVYALVPDSSRQKLDQKAVKMRFVGYSLTQKGYRLYDENKRKIFICQDVIFNETDFGHTNRVQLEVDEEDVSALKRNQIRNHLIVDVQREKESHQFIIMMNTLVSQQQSIQPSL
jgi:hypothetical protein